MIMENTETFDYVRGGKRYRDNFGTTAGGLPIMWFDVLDAEPGISKGQDVREYPEEIVIRFRGDSQGRGVLASIDTKMKRVLLANNGDVLLDTAYPLGMSSNEPDKLSFVSMFWQAASRFISNGRIRSILGFNTKPLFDSVGAVTSYTEEQELEAPTNNYNTHNADGTPINPEPDENPAGE